MLIDDVDGSARLQDVISDAIPGYFDQVATVISNGQSSTTALKDSTETAQFVAAE